MGAKHATIRALEPHARATTTIAAAVIAALLAIALVPAGAAAGDEPDADLLEVSLAFAAEPAHAQSATTITSAPFDPDGAPVTVALTVTVAQDELEALGDVYEAAFRAALEAEDPPLDETQIDAALSEADVHGALSAAIDAALEGQLQVTLTLADGSPPSTLTSGPASVTAGGDPAAFDPPPSIEPGGRAFRLEASVDETVPVALDDVTVSVEGSEPPIGAGDLGVELRQLGLQVDATATSAAFNVFDHVTDCGDGPCQVGARGAGFGVSVDAAASSGVLALNLSDEQLCDGVTYLGLPGGILFDSAAVDHDKRATFLIDRATVQADTNNGRAHYDICMVSETSFMGKGGQAAPTFEDPADGGLGFGPALLEDCNRLPVGHEDDPCIEARTGAAGGRVRIVVRLPAEDPWMR